MLDRHPQRDCHLPVLTSPAKPRPTWCGRPRQRGDYQNLLCRPALHFVGFCPLEDEGTLGYGPGYWQGWPLVKAILDYTHDRIRFSYPNARDERTAFDAHEERTGVCRDYAHLAITLCRCMNIPARYCTGYLGDIGVPQDPAPMDFSAWFEVFMGGRWWTLDARHNQPRIGRIVVARGRDAADVAISTAFGSAILTEFKVITEL